MYDPNALATKADVAAVREELQALRTEVTQMLEGVEGRLKAALEQHVTASAGDELAPPVPRLPLRLSELEEGVRSMEQRLGAPPRERR